ncbi:ribosome recycling factor [Vibrio sp. S9_S30]|uniref:ribosome recycling factor family protein n=1 Tax=Vibrio sp. S9_S30 TaxID=2720226 RepID=UPI001681834C|nr:ribosome recycling factor family protein [Vibrio sp. S9_S30]MBD1555663.1 ribosome recycling factor [Vibrio sp. S9_S30]
MRKNNIAVSLPSLIHRVGGENAKQAKSIALQHQAELKRVRRSRNWQVVAEFEDLRAFSAALTEIDYESYQFIIKKIDERMEALREQHLPLSDQLRSLILANPNITLAELMENTNCTLAQARAARFDADII